MVSKLFSLAGVVLLATLPVLAHHPFSAEYDWKKPVTISGTITKVDWSNPHVHIYVDAKETDGTTKNWAFELGGINDLSKAGWSKTTLKGGDTVTVDAWLSRNPGNMGNVKSLMSGGKELFGASSIGEPSDTIKSTAKVKY